MNFYKLRFINTIFFIIIGILMGIYISLKWGNFKGLFSFSNDYKPVYYGKSQQTVSYTPVYIKKEYSSNSSVSVSADKKDLDFLDKISDQQNPIEDEYDFVVDSKDMKSSNAIDCEEIDKFLKNPKEFKNKNISGKLALLKGEKTNQTKLYFLYNTDNTAYYITILDENKIISNYDSYKIGYFYDVVFLSKTGDFDLNNVLISISQTNEKLDWASGVNAF
ncbi:MAG: hypothetical protein K6357_02025 [Elusimicrobiota bacterium]